MHLNRAMVAPSTGSGDKVMIEFLAPKQQTGRVVILCDGMPSMPGKKTMVKWFAKQGYFTINLRYRGTWESGGEFLGHDPVQDVIDVIEALSKPITGAWSGEEVQVNAAEIFVVGASFGGTAALLSSLDSRVKKVIAIAPVVDWTAPSESEPMDWLEQVIINGYGEAYRFTHENWKRLERGELFQPVQHLKEFDPKKVFIIHAQDDTVIPLPSVETFAHSIGCQFMKRKKGGHLSSSVLRRWRVTRVMKKFLS